MNQPGKLSKALRVIGQVLQQRSLEFFDLRYSDENFFLQCGGPTPPYLDLVEFSCSREEIERFDAQARRARSASFKVVNFESLPEIFRAIGDRIDGRHGHFLRACNSDPPVSPDSITIEYRTRDRREHVEKILLAAAGKHALDMYRARAHRTSG
jgi:hypothetical protein